MTYDSGLFIEFEKYLAQFSEDGGVWAKELAAIAHEFYDTEEYGVEVNED